MIKRKKTGHFFWRWFLCIYSSVLLFAAIAHRLSLDSPGYTSSPLIFIEIIMMTVFPLLVVIQLGVTIFLCFKKRWRQAGVSVINIVIGIVAWVAAMYIDSPTLIYCT